MLVSLSRPNRKFRVRHFDVKLKRRRIFGWPTRWFHRSHLSQPYGEWQDDLQGASRAMSLVAERCLHIWQWCDHLRWGPRSPAAWLIYHDSLLAWVDRIRGKIQRGSIRFGIKAGLFGRGEEWRGEDRIGAHCYKLLKWKHVWGECFLFFRCWN